MDIAKPAHWEGVNEGRKNARRSKEHGFRGWFSYPPPRKFFYQICDRFFPVDSDKRVLEIGCAPGQRLIEFSRRYHYQPFGVEYTTSGVECVETEFAKAGVPKDHCFHSDVLEPSFRSAHQESFDVVVSYGFIEHFTNVGEVIDVHLQLLKPGGRLLIMIPNLRGIYYPLTKFFAPDLIPKHNLSIMKMGAFREIFSQTPTVPFFIGYYGIINMGMLQARGHFKFFLLRSLQWIQLFFHPLLRLAHRFENRFTSPYLLYLGVKK